MGIPAYFKSLTKKYTNIISYNKPECSRLFLDLNCAIHGCVNTILQVNSQHKEKEVFEKEIIHHTIDYIVKITQFTTPSQLLYIAIDGIPPRSKIVQQRKRRFVSSWKAKVIHSKRIETNTQTFEWDTNAITPGTEFMNYLSKCLHEFFIKNNKHKFPFEIILSDSNEPGEGEAKILDYIKSTSPPSANDIIYGLDADLIMLSLLSHKNNIFLLREPIHYEVKHHVPSPFLFLDIQQLRYYITQEYDNVLDYVVLCFFQGNDFLPPLSFLKIRHNGIDMVMQIYKNIKQDFGETLLKYDEKEHHYKLNYRFLHKIFEELKNIEDECFYEAEEKYYSQQTNIPIYGFHKKTPVEKVSMELDNYPSYNKFPKKIQAQKPGWRLRYYHELFQFEDIHEINDVCLNYLEGIEWTMNYYFNKSISKDWYYRYNYSPSILDIYNYMMIEPINEMEQHIIKSIKNKYPNTEYDTDLQLLMCLPPSSYNLIKPELQSIMFDEKHECLYMYPHKFYMTTYLKNYLWEASPILPQVDVELLSKVKQRLFKSS
jgi:5'-3' exonuclease